MTKKTIIIIFSFIVFSCLCGFSSYAQNPLLLNVIDFKAKCEEVINPENPLHEFKLLRFNKEKNLTYLAFLLQDNCASINKGLVYMNMDTLIIEETNLRVESEMIKSYDSSGLTVEVTESTFIEEHAACECLISYRYSFSNTSLQVDKLRIGTRIFPLTFETPNSKVNLNSKYRQNRIIGDFNGDKKDETLVEILVDGKTGEEIIVWQSEDTYDELVEQVHLRNPRVLLFASDGDMDTLSFSSPTGQIFGLYYLINEGDLNQDGKDELGIIVDWADYSNVNDYLLFNYTDEGWKIILSFEIRESDLMTDKNGNYFNNFNGFIKRTINGIQINTYFQGEPIKKIIKF